MLYIAIAFVAGLVVGVVVGVIVCLNHVAIEMARADGGPLSYGESAIVEEAGREFMRTGKINPDYITRLEAQKMRSPGFWKKRRQDCGVE